MKSGITVEGTIRNSPAHLALNAHPSWTWSRYATAWLLRSSRRSQFKPHAINEIERILQDAGYTIERHIDDTLSSVEHQEANRSERMDDRADWLTERVAKQRVKADGTRAKADAVFDSIPTGQPMLVDRHSYKADRNRRERSFNIEGWNDDAATTDADVHRVFCAAADDEEKSQ
jgi:hypothetical protein